MKSGALLGLIACQLVLAEPVREFRRFGENPHSLSNIELLVPLMMDDASEESDESDTSAARERYERARVHKDTPFSNIPSNAFVLDESSPAASQKHKRGHKHSRKQELVYRPRFIYLESIESADSDDDEQYERSEQVELGVEIARACSRLMRSPAGHQNELLLLLCSELQDAASAPPARPSSPASPAPPRPPRPPRPSPPARAAKRELRRCGWSRWCARRGLVPIGENSYWVQSYMRSPRKRPHHMPNWDQE